MRYPTVAASLGGHIGTAERAASNCILIRRMPDGQPGRTEEAGRTMRPGVRQHGECAFVTTL
jgi:hypothetical protein